MNAGQASCRYSVRGNRTPTRSSSDYSPEYIADVKSSCAKIAEVTNHFSREEKRETFDLLDLHGKIAIEEGQKVVYAECILDARRLVIKANGGGGNIAYKSS